MKLYDIFYYGNSMDSSVPFPSAPTADIVRIVNTNQEGDVWTVRRVLDENLIAKLVREARTSTVDHTKTPMPSCELKFREALGDKVAPFRVLPTDGDAEWVPAGYPLGDDRRKLAAYWCQIGEPELTTLKFVQVA